MRKRLFEIIEQGREDDWVSYCYDALMLIAITASIVPLMFVADYKAFRIIEQVTVVIFIVDYVLRWITADFKVGKRGWSFLRYPFTGWAIIDILSILPGLHILGQGFKILRIARLLKVLRLFKFIRYSENIRILGKVINKEKQILLTVLWIAIFYVFLTALIMFNAEPHVNPITGTTTFENFFDAVYWATVSLTTVGYGDIYPVSTAGRVITMLSSVFGIAVVALPSGIITAGYMERISREQSKDEGE